MAESLWFIATCRWLVAGGQSSSEESMDLWPSTDPGTATKPDSETLQQTFGLD